MDFIIDVYKYDIYKRAFIQLRARLRIIDIL